jgi:hypothetical protein
LVCAWLGTGYLRGYVAGTELTTLRGLWGEQVDQFLKEAPMRATSSPQRSNVLAFVLAAALLGPSAAYAQPFLMHVGWQFHRELNTSFAVEMVLGPDGHLRGAITPQDPDTRVAGTHSALRATADRLHSTYGTRWQQLGTDGVLETRGDLTVKVSTTAAPCTACDPVFVIIGSSDRAPAAPGGGGDGGDAVVFNIVDSVASTALIIRIAGLPGQQLQGSPARYFNRPGPDEPLIATFQALGPGQNVEVVLKVLDANDPGAGATLIPVKIKHNL